MAKAFDWLRGALWLLPLIAQAQALPRLEQPMEPEVPLPGLDRSHMVPFKVPGPGTLQYEIDAGNITVTPDGEVRYVVVARSGDMRNVFFEGLKCAIAQYRTYARHDGQQWVRVESAAWNELADSRARHPAVLARQVFCEGLTLRGDAFSIARSLRYPTTPYF
jgi:CNP1-like family